MKYSYLFLLIFTLLTTSFCGQDDDEDMDDDDFEDEEEDVSELDDSEIVQDQKISGI